MAHRVCRYLSKSTELFGTTNPLAVMATNVHMTSKLPKRLDTTDASKTGSHPFKLVYRFPYIVPVRMLARFKIYQTGLTLAIVPAIQTGVANGSLDMAFANSATLAATFALGTLYYISFLTRRLVGLIGFDPDSDTVKIARMTFWGNRKDVEVPLQSIVPLSENNVSQSDIYTDIKTYDGKVKLFMALRFGGIVDLELFEQIFGQLHNKK